MVRHAHHEWFINGLLFQLYSEAKKWYNKIGSMYRISVSWLTYQFIAAGSAVDTIFFKNESPGVFYHPAQMKEDY